MPAKLVGHFAALGASVTALAAGVGLIGTGAAIIPASLAAMSVLCYAVGDYIYSKNPFFARKISYHLGRLIALAFVTVVDYLTMKDHQFVEKDGTQLELLDGVLATLKETDAEGNIDVEGFKLMSLYREIVEMMTQFKQNEDNLTKALTVVEAILLEMSTIHTVNVSTFDYDAAAESSIPQEIADRPTGKFWVGFEQKLFAKGIQKFKSHLKELTAIKPPAICADNPSQGVCCEGKMLNDYRNACIAVNPRMYGPGGSRRSRSRRSRRSRARRKRR